MDERLEHSQRLVYYQLSGKLAIADCNAVAFQSSRRLGVYLRGGGVHARVLVAHYCVHVFFSHVKFSQSVSTVKLF